MGVVTMKPNNMDKALRALAENDSLTGAAEAAGLSRPTLYAYLRDKSFRERLQQQRAVMAVERAEALSEARKAATDCLTAIMQDEATPQGARVLAAKALLQQAAAADEAADATIRSIDFDCNWC